MDIAHNPLDPIPFTAGLLNLALRLKQSGLPWRPHVGCFVWDHQRVVTAPSPFPRNVYFILNLKRFLGIFGDAERMKRQLVWLPTWYQAVQLCRRLEISAFQGGIQPSTTGEEALMALYRLILNQLTASGATENSDLLAAVQDQNQA